MENKSYDTFDILMYLWKKRKPIIIITVLGAITSIVVSLLLPNYFKASTILFPTTFISPSTSVLKPTVYDKTDQSIIGEEDDLERMIQILKSDFISDRIIEKYGLIEHYGLSVDDPYLMTKLYKSYNSNVTFQKTPYQGVIISVVDVDPKFSSAMANDIAGLFDSIVYDMQLERNQQAYNLAVKAYNDELAHIKRINDTLDICKENGVYFYEYEVDRYSEAYSSAIVNNKLNKKTQDFFDDKFKSFQDYGQISQTYTLYLEEAVQILSELHKNLVEAKQNLESPITHKYVISQAKTPDRKDFPKRSIIVIFSTLGAFVFAIALVLFLDFYKELKKRIKSEK